MKKFFKEFGDFIKRGNVLDMAVGVIIGGAFSAIVTALTNNILRPIINWIIALCMGDSNATAYTMLKTVVDEAGEVVLDKSIYIDWGAFISAIINFVLIAFILFIIIKTINNVSKQMDVNARMKEKIEEKMKKGDRLNSAETRWVKKMEKEHPEMVPSLDPPAEPEPEPAPAPTETERLLAEILTELKNNK